MTTGWIRDDLEPGARRSLDSWLGRQGYRVEGDRFLGEAPAANPMELADRLVALHDEAAGRIHIWFHGASGALRKRLRSKPTAAMVGFLLEPGGSYVYEQEKGTITLILEHGPEAAAARLGDRILVLRQTLARIDKKALARWIDKFIDS